MKKFKLIAAVFAVLFVLSLSACSAGGFEGKYEGLRGSWDYEFKQDSKDSGTFEIYENGNRVGKENIRYINSWTLDNDVLTLVRDEETTYYFKIYDNAIIEISSPNSSPKYSDHIAPDGDSFDYRIGNYIFNEDGTVEDRYSKGQYYKQENIIYCNLNTLDGQYYPLFYIYDTDHIADASDVCLRY